MTWLAVLALAAASMIAALALMKRPYRGWEAIAAALLVGVSLYALTGRPDLTGAPKTAAEKVSGGSSALVEGRRLLDGGAALPSNSWLVIGDALARHGQYADAAGVLLGAVQREPRNAEAWLALANALTAHSDGTLSPAALYAYRHAADAAPSHPGPPYFLGLALAQSGRFAEARDLWLDLLQRTPADAPWRADLLDKLARVNAILAQQQRTETGQ